MGYDRRGAQRGARRSGLGAGMSATVLVTGAAGFLGSNLCRALLDAGQAVRAVDNLSQSTMLNVEPLLADSRFRFAREDVRDEVAMRRQAEGASVIVHLAAFKIPRYGNALDTLLVNTHGTESMLKAAAGAKARLVFASTSDVYGKNPRLPFTETDDLYLGETSVKRWAYGRYEDVRARVPEIGKAREVLGFEPRVDLEEGLRRTISWQRSVMAREGSLR